jgi:hypothetical protein
VRAFVALLCVLAASSVAVTISSAAVAPNVRGTFVRSSQTPVCVQGEPCDPPPRATFLLFTRGGHSTRVTLAANGTFAVRLAPGLYGVSVLPGGTKVSPTAIRVPRAGVIHPRFVQRSS